MNGEATDALMALAADELIRSAALIATMADLIDALEMAEAFISGFEDDDMQEGVPAMLAAIRAALAKAEAAV